MTGKERTTEKAFAFKFPLSKHLSLTHVSLLYEYSLKYERWTHSAFTSFSLSLSCISLSLSRPYARRARREVGEARGAWRVASRVVPPPPPPPRTPLPGCTSPRHGPPGAAEARLGRAARAQPVRAQRCARTPRAGPCASRRSCRRRRRPRRRCPAARTRDR